MCGRVVAARPGHLLAAELGVDEVVAPELPARWNVAPGSLVYAVAGTRRGRRLGTLLWGLVPSWTTDPSSGPRPANARMETLAERPHFADALATRRCLVPVDGFYEWRTAADGSREPWFLDSPEGAPLAIAAVWDRWEGGDGPPLVSCALVTTAANADVAQLHDRMPVFLAGADVADWLDPDCRDEGHLLSLLRPPPPGRLRARPVSRSVNSTANDGPELLAPPGPPPEPAPSLFDRPPPGTDAGR